jgi:hypothetical protein
MALLFMDGFDIGDPVQKGWYPFSGSLSATATTRFGTGRSMHTTNVSGLALKAITPQAHVFVGFAFSFRNTTVATTDAFFALCTDGSATQHVRLQFVNMMTLGLYRGSTLLQSYALNFSVGTWNYFEIEATIDDTVGTCTVRLNGAQIFNFTGDTRNGGTSTLIDTVGVGGYDRDIDDVYICDDTGPAPYNTFLGEMRIYSLSPTGAGSSTQWTPDSGSNYARVNEVPYSAANYVQSTTSGQRDTYTMADLPASAGNVLAVQNNTIAKRTDATLISVKPAIKSGASIYYGSAVALTTSDATLTDLRTIDPDTLSGWTVSGVNALEGGFEVA